MRSAARSSTTSRRLWQLYAPIHGVIYFTDEEARTAAADAGYKVMGGYRAHPAQGGRGACRLPTTFSPRELHVWEGFLASHSRLIRHLSAALERECRLTVSEFEVLTALEAVHPGGLRMTDLADRVQLTPSGLSRLVARWSTAASCCAAPTRPTSARAASR